MTEIFGQESFLIEICMVKEIQDTKPKNTSWKKLKKNENDKILTELKDFFNRQYFVQLRKNAKYYNNNSQIRFHTTVRILIFDFWVIKH